MAIQFFFFSSLSAAPFFLLYHMQLHTLSYLVQWCCGSESPWCLYWPLQRLLSTLLHHMISVMVILLSGLNATIPELSSSRTSSSRLSSLSGSSPGEPLESSWAVILSTLRCSSWISGFILTNVMWRICHTKLHSSAGVHYLPSEFSLSCSAISSHFLSLTWRTYYYYYY